MKAAQTSFIQSIRLFLNLLRQEIINDIFIISGGKEPVYPELQTQDSKRQSKLRIARDRPTIILFTAVKELIQYPLIPGTPKDSGDICIDTL